MARIVGVICAGDLGKTRYAVIGAQGLNHWRRPVRSLCIGLVSDVEDEASRGQSRTRCSAMMRLDGASDGAR